jgi:predicted Zn-dependent protease with MMP-like domain
LGIIFHTALPEPLISRKIPLFLQFRLVFLGIFPAVSVMDTRQIIMSYTVPPSTDDLQALSQATFEDLPEELLEFCEEKLQILVEEVVDEATEIELELQDPYELLALYKNGKEISPGVERKSAEEADSLVLYRRAILDMWCETCEDFSKLLRQIMIEELGRRFGFSDAEIGEMSKRHYQGLL